MNYKQTIEQFARWIVGEHSQCEAWLGDYTTDYETQIMLDKSGLISMDAYLGESGHTGWMMPCADHWYRVNDIRIPYGSNTDDPSWSKGHSQVMGPVASRFWRFGTSGWNWANKKSHWVGYDFDSLANHSAGLTSDQLNEVLRRALDLPYVMARTSKSGQGIHLLVRLDPQPTTRNHTEHAQLAKYVLDRMSRDCGFDFLGSADCCGLILWHWQKGLANDCCKRIEDI